MKYFAVSTGKYQTFFSIDYQGYKVTLKIYARKTKIFKHLNKKIRFILIISFI